jgi:uncharacterized membrane protein YozB (DUF420 family)
MLTGPMIILTLKVLVSAVTILLLAALVAIATGRQKLHGRINTLFFTLTLATVLGFEVLLQFVDVKAAFDVAAREALRIHLWFAIPSALLLPVMLFTGRTHRRKAHIAVGSLFLLVWCGTFVTGVIFLPHR